MTLCVDVIKHVPATEFISESIRDNDQNVLHMVLRSCTEKNKMAVLGSGVRVAAFDWNNLDRMRKLLVILIMMVDDEAVLVLLLGFHCRLVACPKELDYS